MGCYKQSRGTTLPISYEILTPEKADEARAWFAAERKKATAVPRDVRIKKALETAERIMERDGLQELRGLAWWDNELEAIKDRLAAVNEEREEVKQSA